MYTIPSNKNIEERIASLGLSDVVLNRRSIGHVQLLVSFYEPIRYEHNLPEQGRGNAQQLPNIVFVIPVRFLSFVDVATFLEQALVRWWSRLVSCFCARALQPCKRSRQRVSLSLSANLGKKLPSYRALCALTSHAPLIRAVEDVSKRANRRHANAKCKNPQSI